LKGCKRGITEVGGVISKNPGSWAYYRRREGILRISRKSGLISYMAPERLAMLHHGFSSSNGFSSFMQNLGC